MTQTHRSGCPINLTLEILGDKWSLLVIRDIIFGNKRHFRDLLARSEEGYASNILTDRLDRLVQAGVLTKAPDPAHKQRQIYSLTEMGIALLPILAQMSGWGMRFLPVATEMTARAKVLEDGGPPLWARFAEELRADHLRGTPVPHQGSVREQLQQAMSGT